MIEYKEYELKDVCSRLSSGKGIPAAQVHDEGKFPVYGGNGLRGYTDHSNFVGSCAIIGRQGAFCGNVRFFSGEAYMTEHAVVVCGTPEHNTHYLAYLLSMMNLGRLSGQSAQPGLSVKTLAKQMIRLPPLEVQNKVVTILETLENKIVLNNKINDNLEQQAEALFSAWFIDFKLWNNIKPSNWGQAPLGTFVTIKRGGSPRPIQEFLSDSGFRWLKISDVTSLNGPFVLSIKEHIKEEGLRKTVFLKAGSLVLSNSATPGIPKILDVDSCIHDGWLYFPESQFSNYYLYLLFKHIRKDLVSLGNGSVFTNLKTDILKNFDVIKPDNETLKAFDSVIKPIFEEILNLERENDKLEKIRDTLLPKLMSGKIDVEDVKI